MKQGVLLTWLLAVGIAACSPTLTAQSFAPPGRAARLDEITGFWGTVKNYKVELSQGVALAFTCSSNGPCTHVTAISDDPRIAEIRPASLGVLERSGQHSQATTSAEVIVGKMPGVTHVHVRSHEGERDIAVTVLAPPTALPVIARSAATAR